MTGTWKATSISCLPIDTHRRIAIELAPTKCYQPDVGYCISGSSTDSHSLCTAWGILLSSKIFNCYMAALQCFASLLNSRYYFPLQSDSTCIFKALMCFVWVLSMVFVFFHRTKTPLFVLMHQRLRMEYLFRIYTSLLWMCCISENDICSFTPISFSRMDFGSGNRQKISSFDVSALQQWHCQRWVVYRASIW